MARKKSVSIARKPTATPQTVATAEASVHKPRPERSVQTEAVVQVASPDWPIAAEPARANREGAQSAAGSPEAGALGKLVYGAVYGVSYGVAFTAILLGRLLPGGALIGRACSDGVAAAGRYFEDLPERRADVGPASLKA